MGYSPWGHKESATTEQLTDTSSINYSHELSLYPHKTLANYTHSLDEKDDVYRVTQLTQGHTAVNSRSEWEVVLGSGLRPVSKCQPLSLAYNPIGRKEPLIVFGWGIGRH